MADPEADKSRWDAHVASEGFARAALGLARSGLAWLGGAPLGGLIPQASARAFIAEATRPEVADALERAAARATRDAMARLRHEERPLRDLLGDEAARALADLAERADPPPALVRSLLEESAAEALMANVLYHGIMEFLRRADLLGPFVDQIPVLGGLRRRILDAMKDGFERRAEQSVRSFLEQFARAAVERAIGFLLAPENQATLRAARRRAVERALARRPRDLLPEPARADALEAEARKRGRTLFADRGRWERLEATLRERFGGRTLDEVRRSLEAPDLREAAAPALAALLCRWLASDEARAWHAANPLPPAASASAAAPPSSEVPGPPPGL